LAAKISVANTTLYTAMTGIVVSGVAGPAVASWAGRRANRQQFSRQVALERRGDLRSLLDQAAELLSAGATNIRLAEEADRAGQPAPEEVSEWADKVYVLEQRLLLRLPTADPVVLRYGEVREALVALGTSDASVEEFETARSAFLESARQTLDEPVTEAETK
jgi:hypothetical protein